MISVHVKSKRKETRKVYTYPVSNYTPPKTYYPSQTPTTFTTAVENSAKALGITPEEYNRRDSLVRTMAKACKLSFGDSCFFVSPDFHSQYGPCFVSSKALCYEDIKADTWVEGSPPKILTLRSVRLGSTILANDFHLSKVNPHHV
jgi:hypothetical protein